MLSRSELVPISVGGFLMAVGSLLPGVLVRETVVGGGLFYLAQSVADTLLGPTKRQGGVNPSILSRQRIWSIVGSAFFAGCCAAKPHLLPDVSDAPSPWFIMATLSAILIANAHWILTPAQPSNLRKGVRTVTVTVRKV